MTKAVFLLRFAVPCANPFLALVDKNSVNGVRQSGVYTADSCQTLCLTTSGCVAVDYNRMDQSCWIHTSGADLTDDNTYDTVGVTQYRLVTNCAVPGINC